MVLGRSHFLPLFLQFLLFPSSFFCLSYDTLPNPPVVCGATIDQAKCLLATSEAVLRALKANGVTVATAESLTAGLISASLIDIPLYGSYVYGGAVVYDSDAKRQLLGVTVPDVYTRECAGEMAVGVISRTRANVGVAVTGNAGPVPRSSLASLGVVDWAVAIRLTSRYHKGYEATPNVFAGRVHVCGEDGSVSTRMLCGEYIREAQLDPKGMVNVSVLAEVRKAIRIDTAILALNATAMAMAALFSGPSPAAPANLTTAVYDGLYVPCGEPSPVLRRYLPQVASESSTCGMNPIPWPQATATSVRSGPRPGGFSVAEFALGMVCGAVLVMAILTLLAQRKERILSSSSGTDQHSGFQEPYREMSSNFDRVSAASPSRPLSFNSRSSQNKNRHSVLFDSLELSERTAQNV